MNLIYLHCHLGQRLYTLSNLVLLAMGAEKLANELHEVRFKRYWKT
jgi:hypothetical protein